MFTASTKGPASSSGLVTVTASNSHSPRVWKACNTDSASTSSTSLPTSVSKMIFTGVASAASAGTMGHNAVIQQASRSAETRKPKAEGRNKLEIRSPESEAVDPDNQDCTYLCPQIAW